MTNPQPELHPIEHGAKILHITRDTYIRNLRNRTWPGHKIARRWWLTDADIQAALDLTATTAEHAPTDPLTPTTRRNLERGKH